MRNVKKKISQNKKKQPRYWKKIGGKMENFFQVSVHFKQILVI